MLYVFIGCLTFGVAFSMLSVFFGSHGHGSFDHGGGIDGHHSGVNSAEAPSPLNPLVLSSAITAFGAVGLIAKTGFAMGDMLSTVISLGFAGIIGATMFFGVVKFMYGSQSNSMFSLSELVDTEAEILTPIPMNGLGEITYVINGVRSTLSAKSATDEEIRRGSVVIIREVSGNIALVQKKISLDELSEYEIEEHKNHGNIEN
ncbi:MAG: hypothetical protein FIA99_08055 [Ruminiclostridium sp.]|nr:hypothetical protein [Ruminiclostridium sp.]